MAVACDGKPMKVTVQRKESDPDDGEDAAPAEFWREQLGSALKSRDFKRAPKMVTIEKGEEECQGHREKNLPPMGTYNPFLDKISDPYAAPTGGSASSVCQDKNKPPSSKSSSSRGRPMTPKDGSYIDWRGKNYLVYGKYVDRQTMLTQLGMSNEEYTRRENRIAPSPPKTPAPMSRRSTPRSTKSGSGSNRGRPISGCHSSGGSGPRRIYGPEDMPKPERIFCYMCSEPGDEYCMICHKDVCEHHYLRAERKCLPCLQNCLLYTSPSPRDQRGSRMPASA